MSQEGAPPGLLPHQTLPCTCLSPFPKVATPLSMGLSALSGRPLWGQGLVREGEGMQVRTIYPAIHRAIARHSLKGQECFSYPARDSRR